MTRCDRLSGKPWRSCPQVYDVLSRRFGHRFVKALATELTGVQQGRWNAERFIVFQMVTLQRVRHVTKSCDIRRNINQRLDA